MKKVINTIKEIISKDASTQTELVTIIETQEEDMPKTSEQPEGQQLSDLKLKRDEYGVEIRKAKREQTLKETRERKFLSGEDQVEEIIKEEMNEEPQQIQVDASFYDKCKRYVERVYPEEVDSSNLYYGISGTLMRAIKNESHPIDVEEFNKLMKYMLKKINYTDGYEYSHKEMRDMFAIETAGIYMVCMDYLQTIQNFMEKNNITSFGEPDLRNQTGI